MSDAGGIHRRVLRQDGRRAGAGRQLDAPPGCLHSERWFSVRDLHLGPTDGGDRTLGSEPAPHGRGDQSLDDGESVPLHRLLADRRGDPGRGGGLGMTTFDYHEPTSLAEALALVKEYGDDAALIAGGTNLVIMRRQGIAPTAQGGIEIGALTTHREVERSAMVERFFPALCRTFGHIATVRIRNQATVGGNVVHADPAQDPPPMLLALNAEIVVASDAKTRTIPATEFFRDFFEVALEPGEIVTAVRIPPQPSGLKGTYVKFLPGSKDDYATVAVAAALKLGPDGTCEDIRIGLGSLGATPLRAPKTEAALKGKKLTEQVISDAAPLVRDEVDPLDDIRGSAKYKREMARVWTERALKSLLK